MSGDLFGYVPEPAPFTDIRNEADKLREQAFAWQSVCEALDEASPEWLSREGTGVECAIAAIKHLATQPQAPQEAGTGLYFDRGEIEYQKLEGGGEGLFLVSTNKTAFYNTEILVVLKTETPKGQT